VDVQPSHLLILALAMPVLGAFVALLASLQGYRAVQQSALITVLITFVLSCLLVFHYPDNPPGTPQYAVTDYDWLNVAGGINVRFEVGLDGVSLWLFFLTALLMLTSVLVSWHTVKDRAAAFYGLLLLLEAGVLGVFAARDLVLFYILFEFTLIPLFFIVGGWGSEDRRYAAIKFFIFTLAGSVLTLLGLVAIVMWSWQHPVDPQTFPTGDPGSMSFSIPQITANLAATPIPPQMQFWIFLALFFGFAIKEPLFLLHTWLPLAHVQAPTAGSVMLAGILLKVGTYGFLRFTIPMLPDACAQCMPWVLWLSVIGIVYGAMVALVQKDMKRLIAYSSVSHLGYVMLGLFTFNRLGVQGGSLQMFNHGIATGGLFACAGLVYERYHTRQIADVGGLARRMPVLAFCFMLFTFSSIALPGLNGFTGEFPILLGMFQRGFYDAPPAFAGQYEVMAVLAVTGVILGAWYMLWLVQRVWFGPLREPHGEGTHPVRDLSFREFAALAPLLVFVFWIGIYPKYFFDKMVPALDELTTAASEAADSHAVRSVAASSQEADHTGEALAISPSALHDSRLTTHHSLVSSPSNEPVGRVLLPVQSDQPVRGTGKSARPTARRAAGGSP